MLPKAGYRQLFPLCARHFGEKFTLSQDAFQKLLRENGLMLRKRRFRPRTTDSRHGFKRYPDLLNTSPKRQATRPGELVVADITYIACQGDFAYLSLLTDAYSRCIVGYHLHPTLSTEGPLRALEMAFRFFDDHQIDIKDMIHHSDRGVQYASSIYTELLRQRGCRISMTQTGDPLHNALAERTNGTIKNSWDVSDPKQSFEDACRAVELAVERYNALRPHQALGMRAPLEALESYRPPAPQALPVPAKSLAITNASFRMAIFDAVNSSELNQPTLSTPPVPSTDPVNQQ